MNGQDTSNKPIIISVGGGSVVPTLLIGTAVIGVVGVGGYLLYRHFVPSTYKVKRGGSFNIVVTFDHVGPQEPVHFLVQLYRKLSLAGLPAESKFNTPPFNVAATANPISVSQPVRIDLAGNMPTGVYDITVDLLDAGNNLLTAPYTLGGELEVT